MLVICIKIQAGSLEFTRGFGDGLIIVDSHAVKTELQVCDICFTDRIPHDIDNFRYCICMAMLEQKITKQDKIKGAVDDHILIFQEFVDLFECLFKFVVISLEKMIFTKNNEIQ